MDKTEIYARMCDCKEVQKQYRPGIKFGKFLFLRYTKEVILDNDSSLSGAV